MTGEGAAAAAAITGVTTAGAGSESPAIAAAIGAMSADAAISAMKKTGSGAVATTEIAGAGTSAAGTSAIGSSKGGGGPGGGGGGGGRGAGRTGETTVAATFCTTAAFFIISAAGFTAIAEAVSPPSTCTEKPGEFEPPAFSSSTFLAVSDLGLLKPPLAAPVSASPPPTPLLDGLRTFARGFPDAKTLSSAFFSFAPPVVASPPAFSASSEVVARLLLPGK